MEIFQLCNSQLGSSSFHNRLGAHYLWESGWHHNKIPKGSTYWTSSQNWMVLSCQDLTAMMVALALGLMRWGLQCLEGQMSREEVRYY